jgi:hypothetical protein
MTVVRSTVNAQNVGLALPHKLRPDHTWIDGRAEKFKTSYGPKQYPPLQRTQNFLHVPKGKKSGDSGLMIDLARILDPALPSVTQ